MKWQFLLSYVVCCVYILFYFIMSYFIIKIEIAIEIHRLKDINILLHVPLWFLTEVYLSEADQRLCFRYTDSTTPLLHRYHTVFLPSDVFRRVLSQMRKNKKTEDRDGQFVY